MCLITEIVEIRIRKSKSQLIHLRQQLQVQNQEKQALLLRISELEKEKMCLDLQVEKRALPKLFMRRDSFNSKIDLISFDLLIVMNSISDLSSEIENKETELSCFEKRKELLDELKKELIK
ncbi:hypothetical protein CHN45_17175 [Vibrio cholerae]|nr:hypothetical protein CHN45_17175 [Vibrio cholerae]